MLGVNTGKTCHSHDDPSSEVWHSTSTNMSVALPMRTEMSLSASKIS